MLSNKTFRPLLFAAAAAFMLMATVEAAPAAEAAVQGTWFCSMRSLFENDLHSNEIIMFLNVKRKFNFSSKCRPTQTPPPVSHAQCGLIAPAAAPLDTGATSTGAGALKPADQETSHNGPTTAPNKNNGVITSIFVKEMVVAYDPNMLYQFS